MKPVHMSHVARNPANQPLVNAMCIVLGKGPEFPTVPSCHNIAYVLGHLNPSSDEMESYRASSACAKSMGIRSSVWPVTSLLVQYGHFDECGVHPWRGIEGAMRRQWIHTVREFVKNSEETFKY